MREHLNSIQYFDDVDNSTTLIFVKVSILLVYLWILTLFFGLF